MNANLSGSWPPPVEGLYCRRCRRAVNTHHGPHGVAYLHAAEMRGGTVEHRADPAPVTEIEDPIIDCDFCSASQAAWVYRCADQRTHLNRVTARVVGTGDYRNRHHAARTRRTETAHVLTQAFGEHWSACHTCGELIEARNLYGLIGRVVEAMPPKTVQGKRLVRVRGELHALYTAVFDTLAGPARIEPGHPFGVWPELSDAMTSHRHPGEPIPAYPRTANPRVSTDGHTDAARCDQCTDPATVRLLLDGFPLYLVCAAHEDRVLGFVQAQLAERGAADLPTTGSGER